MGQITNADLPKSLAPGLRTAFFKQYDETPTDWDRIATVVPSDSDSEDYAWLGQTPDMREFTDERIPKGLSEYTYTIRNREFEASIRVDRKTLDDDKAGQIRLRVQRMAQKARRFPQRLVYELLSDGFSNLAYDGQFFFDTDHSEGNSGTQSNKLTAALSATSYGDATTLMSTFKDDTGAIIGLSGNLLVVPPQLQATARTLLNAELISDGTTTVENIWRNSAELLVAPFLKDTNDWFLLNTADFLKPILLQERTPVEFDALEGDSESGFMRRAWHYGTYWRGNVGYGDWRTAVGSQVA